MRPAEASVRGFEWVDLTGGAEGARQRRIDAIFEHLSSIGTIFGPAQAAALRQPAV